MSDMNFRAKNETFSLIFKHYYDVLLQFSNYQVETLNLFYPLIEGDLHDLRGHRGHFTYVLDVTLQFLTYEVETLHVVVVSSVY